MFLILNKQAVRGFSREGGLLPVDGSVMTIGHESEFVTDVSKAYACN